MLSLLHGSTSRDIEAAAQPNMMAYVCMTSQSITADVTWRALTLGLPVERAVRVHHQAMSGQLHSQFGWHMHAWVISPLCTTDAAVVI